MVHYYLFCYPRYFYYNILYPLVNFYYLNYQISFQFQASILESLNIRLIVFLRLEYQAASADHGFSNI